MARAGRGVATYVREQERADAKLAGLLKCARNALVENLSVDWGIDAAGDNDFEHIKSASSLAISQDNADAAPVSVYDENEAPVPDSPALGPVPEELTALLPQPSLQQAPSRGDLLPPLYPGARCNLFALARRATPDAALPRVVTLHGTLNGTAATLEVNVTVASISSMQDSNTAVLHTLAARALIQDIEDTAMPATLSNVAKSRVVQLGTTYNLASSQTSFVAIDQRQEPVAPQSTSVETSQKTRILSMDRRAPSPPAPEKAHRPVYDVSQRIDCCMEPMSDLISDAYVDDEDLEDELQQLQLELLEETFQAQGSTLQGLKTQLACEALAEPDRRDQSRPAAGQSQSQPMANTTPPTEHSVLYNFFQSLLFSRSSSHSTVPAGLCFLHTFP